MGNIYEKVLKKNLHSRLLILVGDDLDSYDLVKAHFKPKGYKVIFLSSTSEVLQAAETEGPEWSLLITDFEKGQTEFIADIKAMLPELPIIQFVPRSQLAPVADSSRHSIFDFIAKPIHLLQLQLAVEKALGAAADSKDKRLQVQNTSRDLKNGKNKIIGTNPLFLKALEICEKVANCTANIFIHGESGTGKEIFAKYIHEQGKCSKGMLIILYFTNCKKMLNA